MELLLITKNKLKVMLSREDLDGYGIKCENIDYDNTSTRRVFWAILDEAKRETGFDAATSKIFIQVYPDGDGGCEMYVSRIGGDAGCGETKRRGVVCNMRDTEDRKQSSLFPETRIYAFSRVEELVGACRYLLERGFCGGSSAYAEGGAEGRCFLALEIEKGKREPISEFGERCLGKGIQRFVSEHCSAICVGNAAEVIGRL